MEIKGTIKLINELFTSEKGFRKREFVVTTQEQYPQDIKLECTQDRCELLNALKVGQKVTVAFNLKGNEYQGKYYVSLQAWKVTGEQVEQMQDLNDLAF